MLCRVADALRKGATIKDLHKAFPHWMTCEEASKQAAASASSSESCPEAPEAPFADMPQAPEVPLADMPQQAECMADVDDALVAENASEPSPSCSKTPLDTEGGLQPGIANSPVKMLQQTTPKLHSAVSETTESD